MAEESRIVVTSEGIMRNMEGFVPNQGIHNVNSPRLRPLIYPVTVSTETGLGFGNPNMGWYTHHAMPISPGGIGDNPNLIYQVGAPQYPNYVNRGGYGIVDNPSYANQLGGGTSQNPSPTGRLGGAHAGSAAFDTKSSVGDQGSEDGADDQYPGEKVKFLCSFGGKILRRPSDGLLRYAGGHTRIISVTRDINFQDLVHKMNDVCGKPVLIKYQLPDGELDALVSVSCPEDLENMMEEYEKLVESPSTGSAKLRVFLFSASEFDPSGLGQFSDLLDSGQRYVDAVNGIPDGVGGSLTRKVSIGSVGSGQNSDCPIGGNESVDSSTYTQGDGGGVSSPSMSSPRVAGASNDSPTSVVYVTPNPIMYAPPMGVSSPTIITSVPQTFSSLPAESELKRPLPSVGHQYAPLGYDLQKSAAMDYRPATAYMQAYMDPHQQISSQLGYMNPQGLGIPGSIYRYADPPPQFSQQQFIPAVPMSMTSLDPHVGMNTSAVSHVMQSPQTRVDPYLGENAFKARVVQFPVEQNCHVYQPQSPPQQPTVPLQIGGACGLMQSPTQHVVLSDARSTHSQGIPPEKIPHLEDCVMCQKALPHAHSDTVAQGQRNCITVSEAQGGSQPLNRVVVGGALGEVACQGSRNQPRPMTQIDHTTSDLGRPGFSQDLGLQSDKDRILQKPDISDTTGVLVPQGVIGRTFDVKSPYGVISHDISPSHHEDASPQSSVPHFYQAKQEPLTNLSVGSDITPSQNLKPVVPESSTEYSGTKSGPVVKEDIPPFWISYDPIRPIEGRVEKTQVSPTQVMRSNEPSTSPFYNHQREDVPVSRSQIPVQEMFPSSIKPGNGINPDRNQIMPSGMMPSSSSEVAFFNGSRPVDPNQITNPVMLGISSPCPQSSMGTQRMPSEELLHGKPGSDSDYATYKNVSVGETETEASGFQSGIVSSAMVSPSRPSSGDTSSSYGGMFGENWEHSPSNSFYSNHDPWTSQHYPQFIRPKANKDGSFEDALIARGELHKPSGHLNNYSNSENFRSNKDKAEEYSKQELISVAEEVPRKTSGHLNKDSSQVNKDVADEYIRQELKAVAEGVAAMVLQPPVPYAHGMSETSHELSEIGVDSGAETYMAAKAEDVKTKLAEKENSGLPLSEGIGRLQIIKNSDLEELRELGSGTFGTVYHGKWRGSDVAIKRINNRCFSGKPSEQSRMIDDFWNEAINLADLHHPNVVAFYGVVLDGPGDSVATVTEFMVNGSLRQALQRTFDKRKRLLIAMDVAFGMEYLHGKNIVHFDLKSDNLLVNLRDPHRPICKVGDLGLSKVKCNTLISGGVRGTLPWMAPELLNGSSSLVSEKVDVFSFGIVMWELLTGEEPYGDLHYGVIIGGIVSNTLRPPVPESCDPEWRSLMEKCWSSDPSERPSFKEISDILRSMSSSLSSKGQT